MTPFLIEMILNWLIVIYLPEGTIKFTKIDYIILLKSAIENV